MFDQAAGDMVDLGRVHMHRDRPPERESALGHLLQIILRLDRLGQVALTVHRWGSVMLHQVNQRHIRLEQAGQKGRGGQGRFCQV
jgi:hypothetical protein